MYYYRVKLCGSGFCQSSQCQRVPIYLNSPYLYIAYLTYLQIYSVWMTISYIGTAYSGYTFPRILTKYKLCQMLPVRCYVFLCLSQHEDSSVLGQERVYLEEERLRVLARVDELKIRVTDLEQQIQESRQEVRLSSYAIVMCLQSTCSSGSIIS